MASHLSSPIIRGNPLRSGLAVLLCCLVLAGCAPGTYQSAPVDAEVARDTLEHVLEAWKAGKSISTLRGESPGIVVQDFDWQNGMKLSSYEVLGKGKEANANLIAKVKLTLEDKSGSPSEITVTYVVGTSPELTIFRDMLK